MRLRVLRLASLFLVGLYPGLAPAADVPGEDPARAAVEKVMTDYIGLYTRSTIDQWKTLFHPSLSVASPNKDGTILVRNLDQFFGAQKTRFESGRKIGERLENVRVEMGRRIARVTADFIFLDEGQELHGKLGLHIVQGTDGWRIVAIVFAYDAA